MRKTITILALAALWVAACGSSTPSASSPPPAATATASSGAASAQPSTAAASLAPTTLRVLVHQNPPFTDYMKVFNAKFEANHPGVKVEMSIVAPNDLATITQTRIAAKDVDVVDMFAFDTGVQSYMKGVTPPIWQTLADAGSLLDLTGQPFVGLYDPAATRDAGSPSTLVSARCARSRPRPSGAWRSTAGPATSASWRTRSSAPCWSAKAAR